MKIFLAKAVIVALFFFQSPTEQNDPEQEFPGQKMACNNYRANAHPCHCSLATSCDAHREKTPDLSGDGDAEMGTRCKTYCKRDHCHCLSPCTS